MYHREPQGYSAVRQWKAHCSWKIRVHDFCIWDRLIVGEPLPLELELSALHGGQILRGEVRIEQVDKLSVSTGFSDGIERRKEEGTTSGGRLCTEWG